MAGGPVGEVGVPVQLLVFMKDANLKKSFVQGHAPTLLHLCFHVAMTAKAPTQTAVLAADHLSAQVIYFVVFNKKAKHTRGF